MFREAMTNKKRTPTQAALYTPPTLQRDHFRRHDRHTSSFALDEGSGNTSYFGARVILREQRKGPQPRQERSALALS